MTAVASAYNSSSVDYKSLDNTADNTTLLAEHEGALYTLIVDLVTDLVGSPERQIHMNDHLDVAVSAWLDKMSDGTADPAWFLNSFSKEAGFDRNEMTRGNYWALIVDITAADEDLLRHGMDQDKATEVLNTIALPARRAGRGISLRRFMDPAEGAYRSFCTHVNATKLFTLRQKNMQAEAQSQQDTTAASLKALVLAAWAFQIETRLEAERKQLDAQARQLSTLAQQG